MVGVVYLTIYKANNSITVIAKFKVSVTVTL